jgi:hypothetical protein
MLSFREFVEQTEFVEFATSSFNLTPSIGKIQKPLSASKEEIVNIWKNLKPNQPIYLVPVNDTNASVTNKSSFGEDGIRVTGSWQFISSVLSRLKDVLSYENERTKLRLVFRGVDASKNPKPDRQSYVFYLHLQNREHGTPGRKMKPKVPKLGV